MANPTEDEGEHEHKETTDTPKSDPPNPPKPPDKKEKEGEPDDFEERVTRIVQKAIAGLNPTDRASTRRADIEAQAEKMVREASERLKAEEEHAKEHETLKETAEKIQEREPKKLRRVTKAFWGSDE